MSQVAEIKDYAVGFFDGPHATPKESDHGPIFLGIKNVTPDGRLDFSQIRHVSPDEFPRWTKRVTPQKDDIVFSYEATLHRYALIPEGFVGCLGRRMALIRPDKNKINPRFLHYYMLSSKWRKEAEGSVISGATVDRIPLTKVPNFKVDIPSLNQQEIIVEILSAYDDLIENNKRRIELLEESARQLYKEWFVRFRFPGHEHVKIIDGVPEGWELKLFEEVAEVRNGFAFKSGDYSSEGMPVIRTRDFSSTRYVYRDEDIRIPEYMLEKYKKYQLNRLDFLLIMVGASLGRFGIVTEKDLPALQNQNMWAIYTKNEAEFPQVYLIEMMQNLIDKFLNYRVGAAREFFRKDFVKKQKIIVPPRKLLNEFVDTSGGVYRQIETLLVQSEKLTKARDLLLPKLMSGEIAV